MVCGVSILLYLQQPVFTKNTNKQTTNKQTHKHCLALVWFGLVWFGLVGAKPSFLPSFLPVCGLSSRAAAKQSSQSCEGRKE